jgi:putative ABC transport system substrate-binding protein
MKSLFLRKMPLVSAKNGEELLLIGKLLVICIIAMSLCSGCKPQVEKKYVVGIINPSSGLKEVVKGFKEGMEERGYHDGKNVTYVYDGPLNGVEKVDEKINEMLSKNVDLIYSLTTPASKKLKKALTGTDVPGVFGPVFDPVSSGVVESLASPGGQITGVQVRGSTAKALEWLLAIVPDVKRIFVPFHITDKAACQTMEDLKETASKFNIELISEKITTGEELHKALTKIPDDIDALWLTCSHLLMSNVQDIVDAASARNIPTASSTHARVRSGILVTYGENDFILGKQISRLADKLLKGAPPKTVPVETAEFILVVDINASKALGIDIPDAVLKQADVVVR